MVWSVIAAAVFGAAGLYMVCSAQYRVTRRMAGIPLLMAVMELCMCGALDVGAYPVLTAILFTCRLTVLGCCYGALRHDAALARHRRRRREVLRRRAAMAPVVCEATPRTVSRCA